MNKGIALASGDYLCFLNAGDCFHEDDTLQQMVHTINGSELPDVLYGETAIVDQDRHFLRMRRLSAPETLTWKSFKQGMLVCHQAFFPPSYAGRALQLEISFFCRFRLVHPYYEESAHLTQYPSDDYRLSGRRNDYPQSESLPEREISDHGKALRADWNRGASCMVRDPCSYSPVGEGI